MRIGDTQGGNVIIITEGLEDALSVYQAVGDDATVVCTFGKAGAARGARRGKTSNTRARV